MELIKLKDIPLEFWIERYEKSKLAFAVQLAYSIKKEYEEDLKDGIKINTLWCQNIAIEYNITICNVFMILKRIKNPEKN